MTNEELILERLDRIEARLVPISRTSDGLEELRDDLIPLSGQAFKILIRELQDVESSFQLEDLQALLKQMLRNVRHFKFTFEQLGNVVDFVNTLEPLLKSAVPQIINYLDDLEQKGVLRVLQAMLDVRVKIAAAYTAEDIDQIGDGAVAALGLAKNLSDPQTVDFLKKFSELPSKADLWSAKPVGPIGIFSALSNKQARKGLGVLVELTKAMGNLNNGGDATTTEESEPIA